VKSVRAGGQRPSRSRRLGLALVLAIGIALIPTAGQAGQRQGSPRLRPMAVPAPRTVDLFAPTAPLAGGSATPAPPRRSLPEKPGAVDTAPVYSAGPAVAITEQVFPMMSLDRQVTRFGLDQEVAPPDTMAAAGPDAIVETLNRTVSLWSKTGKLIGMSDFDLRLALPAGWHWADPRVIFDQASGRFIISGLAADQNNDSVVYLLVSHNQRARDGFYVYELARTTNGELHDQPKAGVSDDKIAVTWDDYLPGSVYAGSEIWILDKAMLLKGRPDTAFSPPPQLNKAFPLPAQSLSATTTQYVVFNHHAFAGVVAITGTPAQNNVALVETDVPTPVTLTPPPAQQSGGNNIDAGDDRILSDVWRDDHLWTSSATGCVPPMDAAEHDCVRLTQVSTSGTPSLLQAVDRGNKGRDLIYPAVTVTATGDVYVALSVTGTGDWPNAAVLVLPGGGPTGGGLDSYVMGQAPYPGTRWGDYSAISIDPVDGSVWAAAEFVAPGGGWGTAAGQVAA